MDTLSALLMIVIVAALFVPGIVYMEIDKQRTRAIALVKAMTDYLDDWVDCVVKLSGETDCTASPEVESLAQSYHGCRKYRDTMLKIEYVNKMQQLLRREPKLTLASEKAFESEKMLVLGEELEPLRVEYNKSVCAINERLEKKLYAWIWKTLRLGSHEEL
ncbi:MAG: hypothetical protein HUJ65_05155, partial [Oscillospiraceae bacterium]|nr:hypothetical protein [Oscillospiraceae bacterium]